MIAALVNNGYVAVVSNDGSTPANWTVSLSLNSVGVSATTVANFAANQGVNATVDTVVFT